MQVLLSAVSKSVLLCTKQDEDGWTNERKSRWFNKCIFKCSHLAEIDFVENTYIL